MSSLEAAVLEAIDPIYAAALDPSAWDDALRIIARVCSAEAAGIKIERPGVGIHQRWYGLEAKFNAAYVEHYWDKDPWTEPARNMPSRAAGFGDMIVPRRTLEKTAFYNDLSRPYGLDDLAGAVVSRSAERLVTIGVMGGLKSRFDDRQQAIIQGLLPHLDRSLAIGERLLCSPFGDGPTLEDRLRLHYALTPAEARVAAFVGQGRVPKEAAVAMGTSWNTVRFQLRRVYAKTHTTGQSDLARLVARLELTRA